MQDSSNILILTLSFEGIHNAPVDDGFQPMKIQYPTLIKWMEQNNNTNQLLPSRVKDFYVDCRNQFVKIRQTPQQLTENNEKAIKFLEANQANGRIAPQLKCEIKPLLFGHHALQVEAANDADQKIQALMTAFQTKCQDEMLIARKNLKAKLTDYDMKSECEKYAQDKWIELCGGAGELNLYDRNYSIIHNVESSPAEMEGGSSGDISLHITLSAAVISAAFHRSSQLAAAEEAVAAAKKAELKKAQEDALAKKTAAQAAAANRPSAESEASIRERLTKEITANVIKQVLGHLNHPAVPSQSTQRGGSANRGQGRGRGRGRGGVNTAQAQGPRGGGSRRVEAVSPGPTANPSSRGTHPPRSNSRGRQPSRSISPRRGKFQSPPPPKTPRTPRASSSPGRSQTPSANGSNRGRGGTRGRGTPRPPRTPSPAAGRGGRGRGQTKRGTSPRPRR
jgi:hypothetical protein